MPLLEKCVLCCTHYEAKRLGSMYCRPACKHRAMRRRHAAAEALADTRAALVEDLLARQSHALAVGADAAVLAALAREAEALFASV
jgi:exosortase/archaeosortase